MGQTTNRASGWYYDAAGNLTDSVWYNPSTFDTSVQGYTYDAAGSIVYAQQDSQPGSARWPDGMQRSAYISDKYLIYSTVFGKVLMETNHTGAKQKTYVHDLSGKVIAIQQINYFPTQQFAMVRWEHADPSGASYLLTDKDGSLFGTLSAELDPADRAVKMFSGDTQEDEDQHGNKDACKKENDAVKGSTPENCAAFTSEEEAMRYACENNAGGTWIDGKCRIIIREVLWLGTQFIFALVLLPAFRLRIQLTKPLRPAGRSIDQIELIVI